MQKLLKKNIVLKILSPPNYNVGETVKIKGLHYVNQWYDNTKIIQNLWGGLTRYIFM